MTYDDPIIQGVEALHGDAVVELRGLNGRNKTASGYYTDRTKLALDARLLEKRGYTLYCTLQNINPALLARYTNRFEENPVATTSDGDVLNYRWLLIDADPVRPAYVSSTDGEKAAALKQVEEIRAALHSFGWPEGILADSGNGYHLLYKSALPVNPENRELVKGVLEALAFKFDDDRVKIDTSVHNPSRICKLYGTTSGKGDGTQDRPRRDSKILEVPSEIEPVRRGLLAALASSKPEPPKSSRRKRITLSSKFDVDRFIERNNIEVYREGIYKPDSYTEARRWITRCPWNGHEDSSAYIIQFDDGAIAAGCHHNSCQGYGWREYRAHFDPNYDPDANNNDGNDSDDSKSDKADKKSFELPDPLRFPLRALPLAVRQLVSEASRSIVCPPDYIGVAALTACSAAIGNSRRVKLKQGWTEGATLYAAVIAPPGSKKTAAISEGVKPLHKKQAEFREAYRQEKKDHEGELRQYAVDKKLAASDDKPAPASPEKPTLRRTVVEDTTVERFADILNENPRGVAQVKDELTGLVRGMDQYKQGGKGSDRQFYLSAWSNSPTTVDRKNRDEPIIVAHPFFSLIGGIQPDVLSDLGTDRNDGFLDRFLFAYPDAMRSRWSDAEISQEARDAFYSIISSLLKVEMPMDGCGDPFPGEVELSTEAKELYKDTINALREEMETPGFPVRLLGPYAKLEAYLARLSLDLAMTRVVETQAADEVVGVEDVQAAIELIEYFKNMARRVYVGVYGENRTDRLARDLKVFLDAHGGRWEGQFSDLHDQLESEHKPERPEDLSKVVRSIIKRTPSLSLTDHRNADRRWVEIAVIAVNLNDDCMHRKNPAGPSPSPNYAVDAYHEEPAYTALEEPRGYFERAGGRVEAAFETTVTDYCGRCRKESDHQILLRRSLSLCVWEASQVCSCGNEYYQSLETNAPVFDEQDCLKRIGTDERGLDIIEKYDELANYLENLDKYYDVLRWQVIPFQTYLKATPDFWRAVKAYQEYELDPDEEPALYRAVEAYLKASKSLEEAV